MKKLAVFDIGGTSVKAALVNEDGELSLPVQFETPWENLHRMTSLFIKTIEENWLNKNISGIAISSAGIVNKEEATVGEGSPFYEAFGKNIVSEIHEYFQMPVSIENDGNCAALAELWKGNAKGCQNIVSLVVGTAIGGSLILDNQIIRGRNNLTGEFGFILYPDSNYENYRIWSEVGATKSLVRDVAKAKGVSENTLDGKKVFQMEAEGDQIAKQHIKKFIQKLAVQLYNLQYIYDPEKIIIGGGVSKAPNLIERIRTELEYISQQVPQTIVLPEIERCFFGNEANLIGAVYSWLKEFD